MATFEMTIDDNEIQNLLLSDQGLAALLGPILNQVLDAEMTEHLNAAPHEQTDRRQGYRNGSYERQLTTRRRFRPPSLTGTRDRDGRVRLKALVLALMKMVWRS